MGEMVDKIDAKAHDLAPLEVGDRVRVQNQTGPRKTRWSRTGRVMEVNNEYDQYHVMIDGSRSTMARNRRFLRKIRMMLQARDIRTGRRSHQGDQQSHRQDSRARYRSRSRWRVRPGGRSPTG